MVEVLKGKSWRTMRTSNRQDVDDGGEEEGGDDDGDDDEKKTSRGQKRHSQQGRRTDRIDRKDVSGKKGKKKRQENGGSWRRWWWLAGGDGVLTRREAEKLRLTRLGREETTHTQVKSAAERPLCAAAPRTARAVTETRVET